MFKNIINKIKKFGYTKYPSQYGLLKYSWAILSNPFRLIFLQLGFEIGFSGKEQDKWVIQSLNKKTSGYFVDLAATSGIIENNTYLLEKKFGWSGIAIEPNPGYYAKLVSNRLCDCCNFPVASETQQVEFVFNRGIGGIISDFTDNNLLKRSALIERLRKRGSVKLLETKPLEDILDFFNAPNEIDYLSLDIEGSEWDVLKNFPFKKYRFNLMTIERPSLRLCELLFKNDYIFIKNHKVDTFFAHENCVKYYKIKPEIFEELPPKSW
jgi:FkbM family methyltransferase